MFMILTLLITDVRLYLIYFYYPNLIYSLHISLHTFIIILLCYFYLAYFLKYSSCVYYTFLYICLLPYFIMFILIYIIYFLNIDVSICMAVRRIGCWSPVVTSLAYIFTVYMSC